MHDCGLTCWPEVILLGPTDMRAIVNMAAGGFVRLVSSSPAHGMRKRPAAVLDTDYQPLGIASSASKAEVGSATMAAAASSATAAAAVVIPSALSSSMSMNITSPAQPLKRLRVESSNAKAAVPPVDETTIRRFPAVNTVLRGAFDALKYEKVRGLSPMRFGGGE